MKCFVSFILLTTLAVSPIIADDPKVESKTVSLWDQEQDRLRHEIEKLQKQLKAAEALLQKRTANREHYEKPSLEAEQQKVSEVAEQPINHNNDDESFSQLLGFETPPTWQQFFEALCNQHKTELEADGYPPGTVDLQELDSQNEDTLLIWLTNKLRNGGFELWLLGNKLRITKQPPKGYPLLGVWKSNKIVEGGNPSDEEVLLIITRHFGMFFHGGETDTFNFVITPAEAGLNPELELYYPEHDTYLKGSFKVDEDHAEILWGEVSENGLPTGEMVFMKLQRIE